MKKLVVLASMLILGMILTLSRNTGVASEPGSPERHGELHIIKNCSSYTGLAGGFCTITSSNLEEIPATTTTVFYDQAAGPPLGPGVPTGFLDSNVLLHVGTLDWAVGRCTVDFSAYTTPPRSCRAVHVLGRGRTARRVPSPCRCLLDWRDWL